MLKGTNHKKPLLLNNYDAEAEQQQADQEQQPKGKRNRKPKES